MNILTGYEDIVQDESVNWKEMLLNFKDQVFEIFSDAVSKSDLLDILDQVNQIVFLLDCSLSELDDSWGDGHGPLARYFTKFQLRNFIRALWSNNEKRAAMLEKLRD